MIRIFAPPTREVVLKADAVTVTNLVIHIAACVVLLVPLGRVAKEELFDRLVVFLVPPDNPGARDTGKGPAPYNSVASVAGFEHGAGRVRSIADADPASGKAPVINADDAVATVLPLPNDNALTVLEVDSAVMRDPNSAAPEYPQHLLDQGIQGAASVRFVVDTTGEVDVITYRVLRATHPDFAVAVRRSLEGMRFRPALRAGLRVRQLVEQTFTFKITPRDSLPPPPKPAPPA